MLNIEEIKNGIVIDHIKAGLGIKIYNWLNLNKIPYTVAFVANAPSRIIGKKDIIKIDTTSSVNLDVLDLIDPNIMIENERITNFDVLGLVDPNITVNIIENERIKYKSKLKLPEKVENVLICKNPRCISSTEKYITHVFHLENPDLRTYRCEYCDEIISAGDFK